MSKTPITQLEYEKFAQATSTGDTALRVVNPDGTNLAFTLNGNVTAGLVSLASQALVKASQDGTWTVGINSAPTLFAVVNAPQVQLQSGATVNVMNQPTQINTLEQNLISLASGTKILADQDGLWNVFASLPSTQVIGSVNSLPSIYGTVAVAGTVPVSGTFYPSTQPVSFNQLVSLASGTNIQAAQNGSWDIRSVLSTATLYAVVNTSAAGVGQSLVTVNNFPATQAVSLNQLVSLASGTEVKSTATINNWPSGFNVNNTPAVTQSGNWNIQSVLSLASIYGLVGVSGTVPVSGTFWQNTQPVSGTFWQATQPVSFNQLVSLASGTTVLTNSSGVVSLASGTNILVQNLVSVASINGLIDVKQNGNWGVAASLPTTTVIGSLNSLASIYGLVTNSGGSTYAFQAGNWYLGASLATTTVVGSLNSLASIYGTVANAGGSTFVQWNSGATVTSLSYNQGLTSLASGTKILAVESGNWGVAASLPTTTVIGSLNSLASIYGVVSLGPNTNSGWTKYGFYSLSSVAQQVKSSAGELGGWYFYNSNPSVTYVQFFDIANSSVSLGVRQPDLSFGLVANGGANLELANGLNFATAIQIAATTTPNGSTGPTTPIVANIFYK